MQAMVVFGTRPEAIKMAPVVRALQRHGGFDTRIVVTGQHRDMLDQALRVFDIVPDHDLDLMQPGQDLAALTSRVVSGMADAIRRYAPALLLVHGDTTTTLAAALSGFYARVPVCHVEAGLRSGDMQAPWPEEMNRRVCTTLSTTHFAPTAQARDNLLAEGISDASIRVTGNTVVDALLIVDGRLRADQALRRSMRARFPFLDRDKKLLLVTGHRRENFGARFDSILLALERISRRNDVQIVYPVHLNPNVSGPVHRALGENPNVHLVPPQEYVPFVYLMQRCHFIITDSGGLQEEAPSLGKPVLVMRDTTERPEVISSGAARLVGTDADTIVAAAGNLLDSPELYDLMSSAPNPYGDGRAADRIVETLVTQYGRR